MSSKIGCKLLTGIMFMVAVLFVVSPALAAENGVITGDMVTVDYEGTLNDGTVFDSSSRHQTPLTFKVGTGDVIKGFEDAVMGMKKGEQKSFSIQPADAYGDYDPTLSQKVDRKNLPPTPEPQVGMVLLVNPPGQRPMKAVIKEVTPEMVTIDMNHPLAGQVLNFKITLTEIGQ